MRRNSWILPKSWSRLGTCTPRATAQLIGRAYYASFHFAVRALDELGFPPARNANGHAQVVRLLQQCGDSTLAGAAGILGDLHGNRIKADYELHRLDVDRIQARRRPSKQLAPFSTMSGRSCPKRQGRLE